MHEELKRFLIGATITALVWGYAMCAHADAIRIMPYRIDIVYGQDAAEPGIQIKDSTKITSWENMAEIIDVMMQHPFYSVVERTRTKLSYIKEWRAHNYLSELAEAKDDTPRLDSVDFEENQKAWVKAAYALLSFMSGPRFCDSWTCPGYEPVEIIEIN